VTAAAGVEVTGENYLDADGNRYLPLLVQPVLVFESDIVGIALPAPHRDADAILRGLARHP
jgi:hypothetical protein